MLACYKAVNHAADNCNGTVRLSIMLGQAVCEEERDQIRSHRLQLLFMFPSAYKGCFY